MVTHTAIAWNAVQRGALLMVLEGRTSRQPVTDVRAAALWQLSSTAVNTAGTIVAIAMVLVAMSNVSCMDSDEIHSPVVLEWILHRIGRPGGFISDLPMFQQHIYPELLLWYTGHPHV